MGLVTIRGKASGRYVCMNKQGQLYSAVSVSFVMFYNIIQLTARSVNCVFMETMLENYYNTYASCAHGGGGGRRKRRWYLSLRRDGRPRPGKQTRRKQKATQFLLIPIENAHMRTLLPETAQYDNYKPYSYTVISPSSTPQQPSIMPPQFVDSRYGSETMKRDWHTASAQLWQALMSKRQHEKKRNQQESNIKIHRRKQQRHKTNTVLNDGQHGRPLTVDQDLAKALLFKKAQTIIQMIK